MSDIYGKQGIRTLADGDVVSGILDTSNTKIDPAKEAGNLADIKDRVGALTTPAAGSTNGLLTSILTAVGGGSTDIADYSGDSTAGQGGTSVHSFTAAADTVLLSIVCAASVYGTYLVQIDPLGGTAWVTKWMAITSESCPTVVIECENYALPSGGKVQITKTNLNNSPTAYDMHTTINAQQ